MSEETPESSLYELYFDGGSTGNPGPSGAGCVLYCNGVEIWSSAVYVGSKSTNNVAEYVGLITGLTEIVNKNITQVTVKGDSLLVINQMTGLYKTSSPKLKELNSKALTLVEYIPEVTFIHIPRIENKRADELSRQGRKL